MNYDQIKTVHIYLREPGDRERKQIHRVTLLRSVSIDKEYISAIRPELSGIMNRVSWEVI